MGNKNSTSCNEWKILECPCPALDCGEFDVKKWQHSGCGGRVYLNSEGFIKCLEHGLCLISDAKWSCDKHAGDFRKGSRDAIVYSLTIAAGISMNCNSKEEKLWAQKLIVTISKMK